MNGSSSKSHSEEKRKLFMAGYDVELTEADKQEVYYEIQCQLPRFDLGGWLGAVSSMGSAYGRHKPYAPANGPTGAMVKKRKAIKAKRAKDKANRKKARRN